MHLLFATQSPRRTKAVFINLGQRCSQEHSSDTQSTSGEGWTGDLMIADWHGIENYVVRGSCQKIQVRRRVCGFDAGGAPSTLGEARSDLLQCERGGSLQDE